MNVSFGSSVSPSVFGCVVVGIGMLLIWSRSCVLYSDESGVKRVEVDLSGLSWRSFCIFCTFVIECTRKGRPMVSLAKVQRMLVFNRLGHTINAIRHTKWMWHM